MPLCSAARAKPCTPSLLATPRPERPRDGNGTNERKSISQKIAIAGFTTKALARLPPWLTRHASVRGRGEMLMKIIGAENRSAGQLNPRPLVLICQQRAKPQPQNNKEHRAAWLCTSAIPTGVPWTKKWIRERGPRVSLCITACLVASSPERGSVPNISPRLLLTFSNRFFNTESSYEASRTCAALCAHSFLGPTHETVLASREECVCSQMASHQLCAQLRVRSDDA